MKPQKAEKEEEKNRNKVQGNKQKAETDKVYINPTITIITLNINAINTSIKRYPLSEWIKK